MAGAKYRPILPADGASASSWPSPAGGGAPQQNRENALIVPKIKRSPVYTACLNCRRRKIKCDGKLPACSRCVLRQLHCEYDIEPDVSRQMSMKRKYEVIQDEAAQLKELYQYLHDRPESEAIGILRRIRSTRNPVEVLRFVKEGDLLIQGLITGSPSDELDPRARRLDEDALRQSPLRNLGDKQWTSVAPDGIVSELVSSFFRWEQPFLCSFIDKETFLTDMAAASPATAKWCSPLLVNAMCAMRCFTSERAKRFGVIVGKDLGDCFFKQAKDLIDAECGKASLPTVQALQLMYIYSAGMGRDRAGVMYRHVAYKMLQQLKLSRKYRRLEKVAGETASKERMILSKVFWGLFCFESISGFAYLQPSMIPPPDIPRDFGAASGAEGLLEEVNGKPFTQGSPEPPIMTNILAPMCDLSELLFKAMTLQTDPETVLGPASDLTRRLAVYAEYTSWKAGLAAEFIHEKNPNPQTFYLRTYEDKIIIALFRPLSHEVELPNGIGTAGDLCITACAQDTDALEKYERLWPFKEYSIMAVDPLYAVTMTLAPRLYDPRTHGSFTRACRLILGRVPDFPFTGFLFPGIQAYARQHKQTLPPECLKYFQKANQMHAINNSKEVPISFVLPESEGLFSPGLDSLDDEDDHDSMVTFSRLIDEMNALDVEGGSLNIDDS